MSSFSGVKLDEVDGTALGVEASLVSWKYLLVVCFSGSVHMFDDFEPGLFSTAFNFSSVGSGFSRERNFLVGPGLEFSVAFLLLPLVSSLADIS